MTVNSLIHINHLWHKHSRQGRLGRLWISVRYKMKTKMMMKTKTKEMTTKMMEIKITNQIMLPTVKTNKTIKFQKIRKIDPNDDVSKKVIKSWKTNSQ